MAVGCTSLGSFSARFTELVGETPSAYRARDHRADGSGPGVLRQGGDPTEEAGIGEASAEPRRSVAGHEP